MYTRVPSPAGLPATVLVQRDSDGLFIPEDPRNPEWRAFEAWRARGNVPAEMPTAPPAPPQVPETISDRQFAQALALAGTVTEAEALAWASRGELPAAMESALAHVPEADGRRFGARMMLAGATTFERHHPLVEQLGGLLTDPATGKPYDAAALDALWTRAPAL